MNSTIEISDSSDNGTIVLDSSREETDANISLSNLSSEGEGQHAKAQMQAVVDASTTMGEFHSANNLSQEEKTCFVTPDHSFQVHSDVAATSTPFTLTKEMANLYAVEDEFHHSTSNESGLEQSDVESGDEDNDADSEKERFLPEQVNLPSCQLRQKDPQLPSSCTVLKSAKSGGTCYLVGTIHFSKESQDHVADVIRAVQPDVVVLELCVSRSGMLQISDEDMKKELQSMTVAKMLTTLRELGAARGALYLALMSVAASITKDLSISPGGEFRRAYQEALLVPGCMIHLGDLPIGLTLQRALRALTWWQKVYLAFYFLTTNDLVSKEELEMCKKKDVVEKLLEEVCALFPELSRVFIHERDLYLAHSLRSAVDSLALARSSSPVVVGVVGMAHVKGIVDRWDNVDVAEVKKIQVIPPISRSERLVWATVRYSFLLGSAYLGYRFVAKPLSNMIGNFLH